MVIKSCSALPNTLVKHSNRAVYFCMRELHLRMMCMQDTSK